MGALRTVAFIVKQREGIRVESAVNHRKLLRKEFGV